MFMAYAGQLLYAWVYIGLYDAARFELDAPDW